MKNNLQDYYDALERLKLNQPLIVHKGSRITNDAVSIEAGRAKGSIKKSRIGFSDLIIAISSAAENQYASRKKNLRNNSEKADLLEKYRKELDYALAREVFLIQELYNIKKRMSTLTGEKILPILKVAI